MWLRWQMSDSRGTPSCKTCNKVNHIIAALPLPGNLTCTNTLFIQCSLPQTFTCRYREFREWRGTVILLAVNIEWGAGVKTISLLELQSNLREDYTKIYNHGEGPYWGAIRHYANQPACHDRGLTPVIVKLQVIFGNLSLKPFTVRERRMWWIFSEILKYFHAD